MAERCRSCVYGERQVGHYVGEGTPVGREVGKAAPEPFDELAKQVIWLGSEVGDLIVEAAESGEGDLEGRHLCCQGGELAADR